MNKITFPFFIYLFLFLGNSASYAETALNEARQILDSGDGRVIKWDSSPKLLSITFRPRDDQEIKAIALELLLKSNFKENSIEAVNPRDVGDFFEIMFQLNRKDGHYEAYLDSKKNNFKTGDVDIFVFSLPIPEASYLIAASGYGGRKSSLIRQYVQGSGPCFYNLVSRNKVPIFATIWVSPELGEEERFACYREEIIQALGLLNDYPQSNHFNLDNEMKEKERSLDQLLLSSLYDLKIKTGDPADRVVDIFRSKLGSLN